MIEFFNIFVLLYFVLLTAGYIALFVAATVGVIHVRRDLEGNAPESVSTRGRATLPISILVPAHNEEKTVVESVRALLKLRYPEHEVVVVNDGSKDRTLQKLRQAFALEAVPIDIRLDLKCKEIRATYRSAIYKRLIVIDKENGGKADALNCAINASRYPLVCAIDADTLILPDALLRLVRPFLTDVDVVAVGGTICLANGCKIERGTVVEMGLPSSWIARFQVVEYLRAFLVGRLGWDKMGGNLIISGAFGLFRRSAVAAAGGYAHDSVGEDMELVARLRHQVPSWLQTRAIVHLPDPVAFTEAPETLKILGNQRDRWQRGLADTLYRHRAMAFNRRYGSVGLVVMPFYVLFELFGPLVELFGYIYFVLLVVAGVIDPWFSAIFMLLAILIGFLLSLGGIFLEELSLSFFREHGDLWRLILVAFLENFGYRQLILWYRLRGLWKYFRGNKTWGRMIRAGFGGAATRPETAKRATPIAVTLLLILITSLPVGWLLKARPPVKATMLSKTVPFTNRREHKRLMWLLSQEKVAPPVSKLLWDPAVDYIGYDPVAKRGRDLRDSDLKDKNLLFITDTYGVYSDDYDALPRPIAHLELSRKLYGGLSDADMDAIERFYAAGGRVCAEFNTFGTPTEAGPRHRMENLLGLRWTGWAARRVDDFADKREIAKWVQERWAQETGHPFDLFGPGILMIHEDGRVICLQEGHDIPENPLVLRQSGVEVPYTYWFDIVEAERKSDVRAEFELATLDKGKQLLRRFGVPTRFPAIIHDDAMRRTYIAGDLADGDNSLGPEWLAAMPQIRHGLASIGLVPEETRLLWTIYAPLIDRVLFAKQ